MCYAFQIVLDEVLSVKGFYIHCTVKGYFLLNVNYLCIQRKLVKTKSENNTQILFLSKTILLIIIIIQKIKILKT